MKRAYSKREIRHRRIRKSIVGTSARPRLAVFRSNAHLYAQLIDDASGRTLVASSDRSIAKGEKRKPQDVAFEIGADIAKKALDKKVREVVFDRGGYAYHGQVRAVAEGARKAGLVC